MKNILIILLTVLSLASCGERTYEMAYASDRDNKIDILLTDSDTSYSENITNTDFTEYNFTWSADGERIYYT
ncbi:hypothetical protein E1176_03615, partial [Fulvivirga sp. RKSG066]|uniref:TolB family protein n=1 Tax=Fulvivirga aurantia TaxID=2529383 RepID=UPI0012BD755F